MIWLWLFWKASNSYMKVMQQILRPRWFNSTELLYGWGWISFNHLFYLIAGADMRNHYHNHSPRPLKAVRPNRRTMDVHRVFREFADSTSMHGVPRIINARSLTARIFWSITCICAFVIFLWQCIILLERFYSYPKKVRSSRKFHISTKKVFRNMTCKKA